jgi:signal transduction histidine kinase/ActR/RegA family two-component response regulator
MVHEKNDILVIAEDAPWVRELLNWCEKNKFFTSLASPESALALLKQARPAYALIDMAGVASSLLATKIRSEKTLSNTRIVALLSSELMTDGKRAIEAKADYLLLRPLSEYSVVHALQTLAKSDPSKTVPFTLSLSALECMCKQGQAPTTLPPSAESLPHVPQKSIVTNLRRLNSELESKVLGYRDELAAAEKDLDSFAYSVSHDLRAPLRAIEGFSRIVTEDFAGALDPEGQKLVGYVQNNAHQMMRLIEDIVTFYRVTRSPLSKSMLNVSELSQSVWEELTAKAGLVDLKLEKSSLPLAFADAKAMRHILTQLFSNALKFTRGKDDVVIELGCQPANGESIYFIKDNGVGFDMQYAHRLFKLFQRLRAVGEFEGNGIGLAMVQRLVARQGGRVWAEGIPDKGAAFFFSLPTPVST